MEACAENLFVAVDGGSSPLTKSGTDVKLSTCMTKFRVSTTLAAVLFLSGCGGSDDKQSGADGPTATDNFPPSAQGDAVAGQPVYRFTSRQSRALRLETAPLI